MPPVGMTTPSHAEGPPRTIAHTLGVVLSDAEVAVLLVHLLLVTAAGHLVRVRLRLSVFRDT